MLVLHTLSILGATESAEHATNPTGIAALGIDPLAIVAQAGTFLVLFFVLRKYALPKIITNLEERRKTINDGIRLGREMEAQQERLNEQVEKILQVARRDADSILESAKAESAVMIKEAENRASQKSDTMLKESRAKIEQEIGIARRELVREMRHLVSEATEIILEEKLDERKDAELINRALERLER